MDPISKDTFKKKALLTFVMFIAVCVFFSLVDPKTIRESNAGTLGFIAIMFVYVAGLYFISFRNAKKRVCPNCGKGHAKVVEDRTLVEASHDERGKGVYICKCPDCGYEWEEEHIIRSWNESASDARSSGSDSSSWSSSDSGSWGGGSSSGGGAGRSF